MKTSQPTCARRSSYSLVALICLIPLTSAASRPRLSEKSNVSFYGLGPVRAGMTVDEAARVAGSKLVRSGAEIDGCYFVRPEGGPKGISFMVIQGHIARVDVANRTTSTEAGVRVGDTEAKVKKVYGRRVQVRPHKYVKGHYLIVPGPDGKHRIVFETDGQRVTSYRAGRMPEVEYVEGCA